MEFAGEKFVEKFNDLVHNSLNEKGFDFYACELDKDYYEAQEERFRKECFGEIKQSNGQIIKQQTLFE